MNNELTPLENWKEVKDYLYYCLYDITDGCKAIHYTSTSGYLQPHIDNVEKALKALEIIKVVCPSVFWIMRTYTYEEYKKKCPDDTLLQEEYDSLKEILL